MSFDISYPVPIPLALIAVVQANKHHCWSLNSSPTDILLVPVFFIPDQTTTQRLKYNLTDSLINRNVDVLLAEALVVIDVKMSY